MSTSNRLAPDTWPVGNVEYLSELVANDGPLLFAELGTAVSDRSIVIDHQGTDPLNGWRVRWAYPADRDSDCIVTQQIGTDMFTDCDGRTVTVDDLAIPPEGFDPSSLTERCLKLIYEVSATTSAATSRQSGDQRRSPSGVQDDSA